MRQLTPCAIRRRQFCRIPSLSRFRPTTWVLPRSRSLSTSTRILYPRSGPRGWNPAPSQPQDDAASQLHEDGDDDFPDDLVEAGSPSEPNPPPVPDSFASAVTSVLSPSRTDSSLPDDYRPLLAHVLTTFLPANQPCKPLTLKTPANIPGVSGPFTFQNGMTVQSTEEDGGDEEEARTAEAVLALVTPFEGGKHYVYDAVQRVAAEVDADLLRFDLSLGLALDGPAAPLASTGK